MLKTTYIYIYIFLFQAKLFSSLHSIQYNGNPYCDFRDFQGTGFTKYLLFYNLILGSPGPPEHVKVDEITDTTAQISWQEGTDNHSPVTTYTVQARTPFSVGWQRVTTGKTQFLLQVLLEYVRLGDIMVLFSLFNSSRCD